MKDLDFKYLMILIFLNQEKGGYNTYHLIKLLSVSYNILEQLFSRLLELELIEENTDTFQYKISETGKELLFSKRMNNINLDKLDSQYIDRNEKNSLKVKIEDIFYIPRDFKL